MLLIKLLFCITIFTAVLSTDEDLQTYKEIKDVKLTKLRFLVNQEKYKSTLEELSKQLLMGTDYKETVATVNEFVDDFLPLLNGFITTRNLEPMEIEGFEASFKWTIFTGWVILDNGSLAGISTFVRRGDVTVRYSYPNIKISIPLGFLNLNFRYDYEVKFMQLGPTGDATGKSEGNKFTVNLQIDMTTLRAKLDKFKLNTLGSVSLKFSGNILTDWIVNLMLSVVIPILKPILGIVIEGYVVDGLESALRAYNNAICKLLDDCWI
ncbi:hypothetical protein ILUMI_24533 [Ignelater luminosus]|uniref:Uncharacterized protein n=1 Tax=Ignelater luminosus TaxID=2038154 RepID=A0A8K0CA38_IGNLU|nr:hypothetical protein ILUMI_24533 [Ignelater luminosus]